MTDIVLLPAQQLGETYLQLHTNYTSMHTEMQTWPQTDVGTQTHACPIRACIYANVNLNIPPEAINMDSELHSNAMLFMIW